MSNKEKISFLLLLFLIPLFFIYGQSVPSKKIPATPEREEIKLQPATPTPGMLHTIPSLTSTQTSTLRLPALENPPFPNPQIFWWYGSKWKLKIIGEEKRKCPSYQERSLFEIYPFKNATDVEIVGYIWEYDEWGRPTLHSLFANWIDSRAPNPPPVLPKEIESGETGTSGKGFLIHYFEHRVPRWGPIVGQLEEEAEEEGISYKELLKKINGWWWGVKETNISADFFKYPSTPLKVSSVDALVHYAPPPLHYYCWTPDKNINTYDVYQCFYGVVTGFSYPNCVKRCKADYYYTCKMCQSLHWGQEHVAFYDMDWNWYDYLNVARPKDYYYEVLGYDYDTYLNFLIAPSKGKTEELNFLGDEGLGGGLVSATETTRCRGLKDLLDCTDPSNAEKFCSQMCLDYFEKAGCDPKCQKIYCQARFGNLCDIGQEVFFEPRYSYNPYRPAAVDYQFGIQTTTITTLTTRKCEPVDCTKCECYCLPDEEHPDGYCKQLTGKTEFERFDECEADPSCDYFYPTQITSLEQCAESGMSEAYICPKCNSRNIAQKGISAEVYQLGGPFWNVWEKIIFKQPEELYKEKIELTKGYVTSPVKFADKKAWLQTFPFWVPEDSMISWCYYDKYPSALVKDELNIEIEQISADAQCNLWQGGWAPRWGGKFGWVNFISKPAFDTGAEYPYQPPGLYLADDFYEKNEWYDMGAPILNIASPGDCLFTYKGECVLKYPSLPEVYHSRLGKRSPIIFQVPKGGTFITVPFGGGWDPPPLVSICTSITPEGTCGSRKWVRNLAWDLECGPWGGYTDCKGQEFMKCDPPCCLGPIFLSGRVIVNWGPPGGVKKVYQPNLQWILPVYFQSAQPFMGIYNLPVATTTCQLEPWLCYELYGSYNPILLDENQFSLPPYEIPFYYQRVIQEGPGPTCCVVSPEGLVCGSLGRKSKVFYPESNKLRIGWKIECQKFLGGEFPPYPLPYVYCYWPHPEFEGFWLKKVCWGYPQQQCGTYLDYYKCKAECGYTDFFQAMLTPLFESHPKVWPNVYPSIGNASVVAKGKIEKIAESYPGNEYLCYISEGEVSCGVLIAKKSISYKELGENAFVPESTGGYELWSPGDLFSASSSKEKLECTFSNEGKRYAQETGPLCNIQAPIIDVDAGPDYYCFVRDNGILSCKGRIYCRDDFEEGGSPKLYKGELEVYDPKERLKRVLFGIDEDKAVKVSVVGKGSFYWGGSPVCWITEKTGEVNCRFKEDVSPFCLKTYPDVDTLSPEATSSNSIVLKGQISFDGGARVYALGFKLYECSDCSGPEKEFVKFYKEEDERPWEKGETYTFTQVVSNLDPEHTYSYKAFAENGVGKRKCGMCVSFKPKDLLGEQRKEEQRKWKIEWIIPGLPEVPTSVTSSMMILESKGLAKTIKEIFAFLLQIFSTLLKIENLKLTLNLKIFNIFSWKKF